MRNRRSIIWRGHPTYDEIGAVVDLISKVKQPREFGAFSAKQLTLFIQKLRMTKSMRNFLIEHDNNFQGDRANHDNIFKFLRACEYGLPQLFSVVELFSKAEGFSPDYSLFLHDLSRWFRAEELKNLDEEGVPIQISERFYRAGDDRVSLTNKLEAAVTQRSELLSSFERRWVSAALDIGDEQDADPEQP